MTQPERSELLTTQAVAEELGVSPMRVRQMMTEGKLPAPTDLGSRFHVWHRADIEFVRARLAGEAPSVASGVLRAPLRGLPRIAEEILEVPVSFPSAVVPVHARVWHGPAPEGERTIVLLGELHQGLSVYAYREDVMGALAPLLPVPLHRAVWFVYNPAFVHGGAQRVDNLILAAQDPQDEVDSNPLGRVRHFFGRSETSSLSPVVAQLRPVTVAEVERVVGAPVEAYPAPVYTRPTIERWTRTGRTVEVEHDVIDYPRLMSAVRTLHAVLTDGPESDHPARWLDDEARELLVSAIRLLVDEIRQRRLATQLQRWHDGTTPVDSKPPAGWPTTWAARLVPLTASPTDEALISSYPEPFTIPHDPAEHGPLDTMLTGLRGWAETVDRWADEPDGRLYDALKTAADLLAFYIGVYDPSFRERDHADDIPRLHAVTGQYDRAYLAGLAPVTINPGTEHARTRRILLDTLGGCVDDPTLVGHGLDPDGRLVLHYPVSDGPPPKPTAKDAPRKFSARSGQRWYAVRWPLTPPPAPIAAGTRIVGDAASGDRPVYLADPDGPLTPLPADPRESLRNPWSFGYSGSSPGALIDAVISLFSRADGIAPDRMPTAWLDDQITYLHDGDLDLPVDELRRRYR